MTRRPQSPPMHGPRYNEFIVSPKVRVIDENGENLGVLLTAEAIEQAAEVGLDLVEVSPNADPPVAKFLDFGTYKYEAQNKANLARKSRSAARRVGKAFCRNCSSRCRPFHYKKN